MKVKSLSRIRLLATPWTAADQAPPSMGFARQEYRSGVPFPSLGDLPNLGIKPRSPALQAVTLPSEPPGKPYPIRISTLFWAGLLSRPCRKRRPSARAKGFPGGSDGKVSASNAGGPGSIPGLGRSPGERNSYPLQYTCQIGRASCRERV